MVKYAETNERSELLCIFSFRYSPIDPRSRLSLIPDAPWLVESMLFSTIHDKAFSRSSSKQTALHLSKF
jgi:hypothetical protein